jgi:hypothetical protein
MRRRHRVVVELAGKEHLVGGGLHLGEQFVRAVLAGQRIPEAWLAERRPQGFGQIRFAQVARPVLAAHPVHRPGQQQAGRRIQYRRGGQLERHR